MSTYDVFCKALDDGKEVRSVFCDISKAFDRVWHKGLLLKLKCVGIRGSLLKWFSNYHLDRKQRVVIPSVSSDSSSVIAGVPQGSILGPLLFLIFINDIVVDLDTNVRLFADDTSQYQKDELDKIQLEEARIVSGTTKLVSSASLYMELGWESLSSRRRKHKLVMFYKIINGLCPDDLAQSNFFLKSSEF